MDRLFVYEREYCNDKYNIDGSVIKHALVEFAGRNLDSCIEWSFDSVNKLPGLYASLADAKKRIVPVGSLEFVDAFLKLECGNTFHMQPIEIPDCLQVFLYRSYYTKKGKELSDAEMNPNNYFVKDIDALKRFNSLLCVTEQQVREQINQETRYSVSQFVKFLSEWRIFVYQNEVLSLEKYQGDPMVFPNASMVRNMIATYCEQAHPEAYTLDVGIRINNCTMPVYVTEPIEIHPFVGCGLYGFYDTKLLDMLDAGYQWYKQQG